MMAYWKLIGSGCIALLALGCGSKGSDSDDDDDMTGGTSGTGGSTGGTGGSTGGTSGASGSGGSSGTPPIMTTMAFDAASEVCPAGSGANVAGCWKFVDSNADANTSMPIPDEEITYQHNATDGDPDPGSFEATIPYTLPSQWVSFGINFDPKDLTNRTISARVQVASGLGDTSDPSIPAGGTKIYAKSGTGYCYANGGYTNLGDSMHPIGAWQTITFNLARTPDYEDPACAMPFDPADVREIGIQIDSGSTSTTATTAVFLIDTVTF